ncbi:hypothetical protein PROSTU_02754 [Providencia stuartii ATCC 25827]|uniref:Uncharacterized protein n=1 Tax=Providencia stuartii ATCC 25827 TaxID=471874 RepID=A0AA87CT94_PROST|nr:hypothetical protein PROSTU_02754 [Providencia stuartii ATCC 25827]
MNKLNSAKIYLAHISLLFMPYLAKNATYYYKKGELKSAQNNSRLAGKR